MDELETVFDAFADAAEAQLERMAGEIRTLKETVEQMQVQVRSAPTVLPVVAAEPAPKGEPGNDGVGIAAVSMRGADLIIRLTDGTEHNVGRVAGEKGEPGPAGEASAVPGPKGEPGPASVVPGPPGARGADGIATREEIESIVEARAAEIQVRTLADAYRDVYKQGESYKRGELVTWGGSLYLAKVDTGSRPDGGPDWRQIVTKGRDGQGPRR